MRSRVDRSAPAALAWVALGFDLLVIIGSAVLKSVGPRLPLDLERY